MRVLFIVGSLVLFLLLVIAGFAVKLAVKLYRNRQEPFDSAKHALVSDAVMNVIKLPGGHILFVPTTRGAHPRGTPQKEHGVAYLPGGLVNHLAYAPLCREIARLSNLPVLLVRATLRLAVLRKRSIVSALETHATTAQVTSWVLGGHSLGGITATQLIDLPSVYALFLHGAYPEFPVKELPVLQVLAEHDSILNAEKVAKAKALYMPAAAVSHVIAGGNHAGFGLYGPQRFPKADGERTISLAEQQLQVAQATADWLRTLVHTK